MSFPIVIGIEKCQFSLDLAIWLVTVLVLIVLETDHWVDLELVDFGVLEPRHVDTSFADVYEEELSRWQLYFQKVKINTVYCYLKKGVNYIISYDIQIGSYPNRDELQQNETVTVLIWNWEIIKPQLLILDHTEWTLFVYIMDNEGNLNFGRYRP